MVASLALLEVAGEFTVRLVILLRFVFGGMVRRVILVVGLLLDG